MTDIPTPDGLLVEALTYARDRVDEMRLDGATNPAGWDGTDWMAVLLVNLYSDGAPDRRKVVGDILESNIALRERLAESERNLADATRTLIMRDLAHGAEVTRQSAALTELIVLMRGLRDDLHAMPLWRPWRYARELADRIHVALGGDSDWQERAMERIDPEETVIDRFRAEERAP